MNISLKLTSGKISKRIINTLTGCLLAATSSLGLADKAEPTVMYIEESDLPFSDLLDKISARTGYRIELVGEWPNTPVTTPLKGVSLEAGLKKIIKELDSVSHILLLDNGKKTVRIASVRSGKDSEEETVRVFSAKAEEIRISPPSPSGEAGLTANQLSAIKAEHRDALLHRTDSDEVSPPSEFGPGLTIAQFESIKKEHNILNEGLDGKAVIAPPSKYGAALTKAELDRIKKSHGVRILAAGKNIVVSPPSDAGSGLTLGELEKIKAAHASITMTDETIVSPPSESGPGMTAGELSAIKDMHKQNMATP